MFGSLGYCLARLHRANLGLGLVSAPLTSTRITSHMDADRPRSHAAAPRPLSCGHAGGSSIFSMLRPLRLLTIVLLLCYHRSSPHRCLLLTSTRSHAERCRSLQCGSSSLYSSSLGLTVEHHAMPSSSQSCLSSDIGGVDVHACTGGSSCDHGAGRRTRSSVPLQR